METGKKIKTIGVLTSGGDAPGMNPAIRAVVRTAISQGMKVVGIKRGYSGLLENDMKPMTARSVRNIIQRGGTILQTSRCPEFHEKEHRKKAAEILKKNDIDALVVIGGNGSFAGALALFQETGFPVVGIPGTIDNDVFGSEYTIGFDTAVQTAMEAVDKVRDTAASHKRNFFVEVMGRKSEAIALHVGVCTGAESIIFPHKGIDYEAINDCLQQGISRGKYASIIIVQEADKPGISYEISEKLYEKFGIKSHVCILGHTQRGGKPTAIDRFIASKMGFDAVHALAQGTYPVVATFCEGKVTLKPFEVCIGVRDPYDLPYGDLAKELSI
jgi:6-phosphofructokinase 1